MNGEFWDTVARSAEFSACENEILQIQENDLYSLYLQFGGFSEHVDFNNALNDDTVPVVRESAAITMSNAGYSNYDPNEIRDILIEILPYCSYDPENRDTGVIIGSLQVGGQYLSRTIQIYADNLEVLNGVCRILNLIYENDKTYAAYPEFADTDDFFDYYTDTCLRSIAIIDSETGEIREMPMEEFRKLAPSMAYMRERGYSSVARHLRVYDSRYWITASFENPFVNGKEEYHNTRTLYLREGAVNDDELTEIFNSCK